MRFSSLQPKVLPLALVLTSLFGVAMAQDPNICDEPGESPDVIVGDLHEVQRFGSIGDVTAFSVGTVSCNIGTCWLNWFSNTNQHPVIGQNMYRLHNGRFEQIGQSWLKHGFFALSETLCDGGCVATSGTHLGVNCSDPYSSGLNGSQPRLGPKSEVNASTGEFLYPFTTIDQTGDALYKRLQVRNDDMDPAQYPGALYFVEGQYVTGDDAAAGNNANNASYRPVQVTEDGGAYSLTLIGQTERELAAVQAWPRTEFGVKEANIDVPGDGRFIVAAKVTDLGDGTWHYEYAVQNLTSHRSGASFRVPVPDGAVVSNIGFHDVDYHSGEPYDATDWQMTHDEEQDVVVWTTESHDLNPDANALRWGTLYNFRFDVDTAAVFGPVTVGLFRPGTPEQASAATFVPNPCNNNGICNPNETCVNCAADCVNASAECCGDGTCDSAEDSCACAADCGPAPTAEFVCVDGFDDDCDGATDCEDLDCCTDGACLDGIDADADGVAECDCDDGNNQIWATPGEVLGLALDEDVASGTTLTWSAPLDPGAANVQFETLRSAISSDFQTGASCVLLPDPTQTVGSDTEVPASGTLFFYLVRAVNGCPAGVGPLGHDSGSGEREGRGCP